VVKTNWPAALRTALTKAAADPDGTAFLATLQELVAALHDGHGNVRGPAREAVYGLPILWDWIQEKLVVTRVGDGADALKPGDVVLAVDGQAVADLFAARGKLVSAATPQWRRWRILSALRLGPIDPEVKLEVKTPAGKVHTVTLRRTAAGAGLTEPRPAKIEEIKPGIFYVDLDRVTDAEFTQAVPKLKEAKGILFDLRGYPSQISTTPIAHLTDKAVTSARWNIPLVRLPDRKEMAFTFSNWSVQPKEPRFKARVAFLTDGRAISYAETYLGIIEHYKLAAIVGQATAGTNGNVNPFTLPGGYRVSWTGMKVLKHDGSRHHGVGILPTVPVTRSIQGVAAGKDEVLEKALEVVGG
jgi:C-terminal processing protease CtpA/Prc